MKRKKRKWMKQCYLYLILTLALLLCRSNVFASAKEEDRKMGDCYYETNQSDNTTGLQTFSTPAAPANTIAKGVDLSRYDGDLDFTLLKANIDFAVLRCGYGMDMTTQDDPKFESYVKACVANNIPFGIYLFSYADTLEKAQSEAAHTLRLLNQCKEWGASLSLPVFYDMESLAQGAVSASLKAQIAQTYCSILNANGYITGIYANTNWWTNYLTDPYFKTITYCWVARYSSSLSYTGQCDMWQCSEDATFPNMSGTFDLNYMFTDMLHIKHPALTTAETTTTTQQKQQTTITRPSKTAITSCKYSKKYYTVKWKKVARASGYELVYRLKGKKTCKYCYTKTNYKKIKGLKKNKIYFLKVRAYTLVNGKKYFGTYSATKKKRIR